ncbi:caspase domain-containing protein [Kribbella sp. VKM Ac-2569]|uniref:caspase family protein n=1 Tax=Kribbella sp. VKM Ac-2569 TaxID=2512220 RepID=UPI0010D94A25|nr:caspase family protein [Kribbella sp. VKM Ac-2569]RZT17503.1 caspase domain-containing protein [Kribbella sp. VKM Ac-2569]
MTRKALLIGAQTNNLTGVLNDVEAMAGALEPRGFQIERLVTPHATQAAVLDAYEKLIVDTHQDDAVVVYYSGHGGRLQTPEGPDLQFIVPDDYADSDDDDFRGITGIELSVLLARLTKRTANATVVLDCCHAAHMSRDPDLRVKSLLRAVWKPTYEIVERRLDRLVEDGLQVHERHMISNPQAVRVVACSPSESAFEGVNRDGVGMGLLTDALSRALREAQGLRVNWSTLIDAVRRDVQDLASTQRPEAEGPSERQPFETTDLEPLDTLPVVTDGPHRIQLLGAPLLGVEVGDEFAIMPAAATGPEDGPAIGAATVDRVLPTAALAQLRLQKAGEPLPPDARAHRTHAAAPALPVRLPQDHPVTADLVKAMLLRPLLRPAGPDTDGKSSIEVAVDAQGELVVQDNGSPLHPPYPPTPLGISSIMANLQRIAQAAALRRLAGDPAMPLEHGIQIEWGRVHDGQEELLPLAGALLFAHETERVFFRLRNAGERAMFVSLIDIGIASRISILTAADPGGVRLAPGASYTYGWNDDLRRLVGVGMTWPEGVEMTVARPETVIALISDGPVDVGALKNHGVRTASSRREDAPKLERLLSQIGTGATREVGDAPARSVRYSVEPIDFTVSPTPPPTPERASFLIDDRPRQPVRLLSPRGLMPGKVAVRIAELIVHRNRALLSADVRVDAVVLTGGAGDQPVYRAATTRFSNIRDGERLPLDNLLIYHGPAVEFLDIAVWVSRDATGSLALSDLLAEKLSSPALQAAGTQLAGLALVAPQAAVAVAAVSAGAVLVNTAYELLSDAVGQSIGLYRTSLLAQEQFGIGRHVRHPQDFSFTFSVEVVA